MCPLLWSEEFPPQLKNNQKPTQIDKLQQMENAFCHK